MGGVLRAGGRRPALAPRPRDWGTAAVAPGKAELEKGVATDPTAPDGYADLARLAIAQGDLEAAVGRLREGLRWNPHQPVLQGLWAVAALTAQSTDPELAGRIADELEQLPPDTPDAWYWLAAYRRPPATRLGRSRRAMRRRAWLRSSPRRATSSGFSTAG